MERGEGAMGRGKERWGGSEGVRGEGEGERRGREERERWGKGETGKASSHGKRLPGDLAHPGPLAAPLFISQWPWGGGPTLTPPGHTSLATTATDLLLVGARLPSNVQPGCLLPKQS
jgi:hypothetical protein